MILTLTDFAVSEVRQTNVSQESSITKDTKQPNEARGPAAYIDGNFEHRIEKQKPS